ncbi:hypothetical protein LSM04_003208 [Trypanosoma melophagium]|uniref:uncharacterized protein n=1 Tax=Trypanosoma melophagium TaxID=715481 RepID=UPI00351A7E06|nr:hypothetical protein LSM04_003208 [Trypanosoma melophagium]
MENSGSPQRDEELDMASRDYAIWEQGLRKEAFREVLGEIAGEMYSVVFCSVYRDALEKHRREWGEPQKINGGVS